MVSRKVTAPVENNMIFENDVVNDNPFVQTTNFKWYDYLQIFLMSLTIAPIRAILLFFLIILTWVVIKITLLTSGGDYTSDPTPSERRGHWFVIVLTRMWFFVMGFHYIDEVGFNETTRKIRMIVVAPHRSYMDSFIMSTLRLPSPVSRAENRDIPLLGDMMAIIKPIFVDRKSPQSKQKTVNAIKQRIENTKFKPVIIFPEGTCTNGRYYIQFRTGGFQPGVPVLPVYMDYSNRKDTVSWTYKGASAPVLLWLTLCQFHTYARVRALPVYYPSEEEKIDSQLYAENVRKYFAKLTNVPRTKYTYDDTRIVTRRSDSINPELLLPPLHEIHMRAVAAGITQSDVIALKEKLLASNDLRDIHVPDANSLRSLFGSKMSEVKNDMHLMDRLLDVLPRSSAQRPSTARELLISLYWAYFPNDYKSLTRCAFALYADTSVEHDEMSIDRGQFCSLLQDGFGQDNLDSDLLFSRIDSKDKGHLSYIQFRLYIDTRPMYSNLFSGKGESS